MNCYKIHANKNCQIVIENDNFNIGYVYVYILQRNRNNCSAINEIVIRENEKDPIVFNIGEDGYYLLCKLIVPIDVTKPYYYYNGKFYKGSREIELQELIDTNPEITLIEISYENYFLICHLRHCYVDICQKIFDLHNSTKCESSEVDKELIYRRDLIWSAINVINYLVEDEQFDEAERLLERITGCNGLCYHEQESKDCGCCCGKVY